MSKIEILVICRHEGILATVVRLVNNNPEWHATGAVTDDEAISVFRTQPFKLVLLGSGIDNESETMLRKTFITHNAQFIVVQHYGGGSGLLSAEIYQALGAGL